jgi:cytochrome b involved in lipid metabolism
MTALTPLEFNLFDTITGLPVHPLVVHAVVVLLPVSALALILIYFVPRWRKPYGWLTVGAMAAGTAASFVAKQSGEALAQRVGLPAEHSFLANTLVGVAIVTLVVAAVWFWMQRKAALADTKSMAATVVGGISVALAVAVLGLTVLVGHSGATAVWAAQIAAQDNPSAGASPTSTAGAKTFTMTDVAAHASAGSCWTVIDGKVYDVTKWEGLHPGGQARIVGLCGTDGGAAFHAQHGTQTKPNQTLAGYEIGTLSATPATPTMSSASPTTSASVTASSYTIAQVAQHASATSCWSAIDGNVYDLTQWIGRHPGGKARILSLCGKDGTAIFHGEHHKEALPNKTLAGFVIGKLG